MKGLTIVKRTSKQEGTIRLRFRLRDGRGVDMYHKSEIDQTLKIWISLQILVNLNPV